MEGELTHVLEGHTRDVLCLDVQKEAAFSGKDGKNHHNDGYFHSIACDLHEDDVTPCHLSFEFSCSQ